MTDTDHPTNPTVSRTYKGPAPLVIANRFEGEDDLST